MSSSTTDHPLPAFTKFKALADGFKLKKKPDIIFPPPSWFIDHNDKGEATGPADSEVDDAEVPEPTTFAEKLKRLIDTLPIPSGLAAAVGIGQSQTPKATEEHPEDSQGAGEGPPIPDVVDPETMRLLSSKNVMNGGERKAVDEGRKRESVWSALDRLSPGSVAGGPLAPPGLDTEQGVMMYAPLEPTNDSEVELAESLESSRPKEAGQFPAARKGKGKEKEADAKPTLAPTERLWVPSTTNISVFTTWWGYRLYLPPPVMATLNSSQLKATKRAAMITTALQWLLSKLPLKLLPANLKMPVLLLRRLGPFVGYIGVFMAWSWTRINACDQGNGVVLSATWLLPVALMPMTWDAGDIHGPPNMPPEAAVEDGKKTAPTSKGAAGSGIRSNNSKPGGLWGIPRLLPSFLRPS